MVAGSTSASKAKRATIGLAKLDSLQSSALQAFAGIAAHATSFDLASTSVASVCSNDGAAPPTVVERPSAVSWASATAGTIGIDVPTVLGASGNGFMMQYKTSPNSWPTNKEQFSLEKVG
jgi:hypothetical protein